MQNNINFNNSLIQKIDNIEKISGEFDEIFSHLIKIQDVKNITPNDIEQLYKLTKLFKFIRSEHGSLLILLDKKKDLIKSKSSELTDELVEDLYDLSTFDSIISNVSDLVSNIDFEFKRIAIMFPKFMNKKPLSIILFIDKIYPKNKYIKMIEEVKKLYPENIYKVFECKEGSKVNCGKYNNKDLILSAKNVPNMFLINDSNITMLPTENIQNSKILLEFLK
jgi:hypothetical protein